MSDKNEDKEEVTIPTATGPYQLLPPLSKEELENLRESIKEKGVLIPIVVDENGIVIDGHHRKMICDELGIECPKIVRENLTEQEKRSESRYLNIARRHLNTAQKRVVIAGELWDNPSDSNNSIAKRLGVSDTTVAKVRDELGIKIDKVVGADGKVYKASKIDWDSAMNSLPSGGKSSFQQMSFNLHHTQVDIVKEALRLVKLEEKLDSAKNSNATAITKLCEMYIDSKEESDDS